MSKNKRQYSLSEELISSISHGVGALLGIAELVVGIIFALHYSDAWGIVSMAIYGTSLILLFLMSTLYHAIAARRAKAVFQVFDHVSIFLLIAGTYTPFTLVLIREFDPILGWSLFSIIWILAVVGIVFNSISLHKFAKISFIAYLGMGWLAIFAIQPLSTQLPLPGLILLVGGGVVYSIGAVFYAFGRKIKYFHSLWHFFVLGGSLLHYFSILLYVIIPSL